jgi:hypothetical protein
VCSAVLRFTASPGEAKPVPQRPDFGDSTELIDVSRTTGSYSMRRGRPPGSVDQAAITQVPIAPSPMSAMATNATGDVRTITNGSFPPPAAYASPPAPNGGGDARLLKTIVVAALVVIVVAFAAVVAIVAVVVRPAGGPLIPPAATSIERASAAPAPPSTASSAPASAPSPPATPVGQGQVDEGGGARGDDAFADTDAADYDEDEEEPRGKRGGKRRDGGQRDGGQKARRLGGDWMPARTGAEVVRAPTGGTIEAINAAAAAGSALFVLKSESGDEIAIPRPAGGAVSVVVSPNAKVRGGQVIARVEERRARAELPASLQGKVRKGMTVEIKSGKQISRSTVDAVVGATVFVDADGADVDMIRVP